MIICLNRSVLDFMAERIGPEAFVLEFGAGGSSRWFADRCGRLLSVETSPVWAQRVSEDLAGANCDWRVALVTDPRAALTGVSGVDLALVDGVETGRDTCARLAWPLLKSGGWLVFDDAQRERHAGAVAWLSTHGEPVALRWAPGDVESATERLALAWRKQ